MSNIRAGVSKLNRHMKKKLSQNHHKDGWDGCSVEWLRNRMHQEMDELAIAIHSGDSSSICEECADIANFAMMIVDNLED